jgi:hypothetical protein
VILEQLLAARVAEMSKDGGEFLASTRKKPSATKGPHQSAGSLPELDQSPCSTGDRQVSSVLWVLLLRLKPGIR